jgi:hypothetical protein
MSDVNRVIDSPTRRERMVLTRSAHDTRGELIECDHIIEPGAGIQTEHVHLTLEERFEVTSGTAVYIVDGEEKVARAGESVIIRAGQKHIDLWNRDGLQELRIRRLFIPSLGMQVFIETWFGCAGDNFHVDGNFELNYLQQAITAKHIDTETYLTNTPVWLQRLVIPFMAAIARARGYKPYYEQYSPPETMFLPSRDR